MHICDSRRLDQLKDVDLWLMECSKCAKSVRNTVYAWFNHYSAGLRGFRALSLPSYLLFWSIFCNLKIRSVDGIKKFRCRFFENYRTIFFMKRNHFRYSTLLGLLKTILVSSNIRIDPKRNLAAVPLYIANMRPNGLMTRYFLLQKRLRTPTKSIRNLFLLRLGDLASLKYVWVGSDHFWPSNRHQIGLFLLNRGAPDCKRALSKQP